MDHIPSQSRDKLLTAGGHVDANKVVTTVVVHNVKDATAVDHRGRPTSDEFQDAPCVKETREKDEDDDSAPTELDTRYSTFTKVQNLVSIPEDSALTDDELGDGRLCVSGVLLLYEEEEMESFNFSRRHS